MSTTIDNRVVEMRFDNQNFERNVSASLGTLDKLKQGLNLSGASKGLENVSAAAKSCDFTPLSSAVETVKVKFSALEVMAVTALSNITNSAVNAGKRLASAFTIEPIKTGLAEYETQINAVQTILANTQSKGTTLDDVNGALDTLNAYADKTIYNFTEMTRNIGTFTAAGVDLDTSVSAIQGIANLAAVSGSTSQQASTAMYQLSQALSTGTVKLMDWNSVVNAGMGGEVFQNALKETARAHGVAVDEIIEANGSFRDSLQDEWLTADILTETLSKMTKSGAVEYLSELTGVEQSQIEAAQKAVETNKDGTASYEELATQLAATGKISKEEALGILNMADTAENAATKVKTFTQLMDTLKEAAQSGWTQTWEILIGDFEEAKELWTKVSDIFSGIINSSAEARNTMLQGWAEGGGRDDLLASFKNIFEALKSIITPIKEAFREIFPPTTSEQLIAFTKGLKELTDKLKLSDTAMANLKSTFKGIFAIVDIVRQAFAAVFRVIAPLFGGLDDLGGGILSVTGSIGEWIVKLRDSIQSSDIFYNVLKKIVDFVATGVSVIKSFINTIKENFSIPGFELLHSFLERIHERMSQVGEAAGGMKDGFIFAIGVMGEAIANSKIMRALQALWDFIAKIGKGISTAFGKLAGGLVDNIADANFDGILDFINTAALGSIAVYVTKFIKGLSGAIDGVQGFMDNIVGILDGVKGCLTAYQEQIKAGTLVKIATAVAILAASIFVISLIDSEKLSASLGAITLLFADLMGSMGIFSKISGSITGVTKSCAAMIAISIAVLILASALKKIADLEFKQLAVGLTGVVALTALMVGVAKILGSGSKAVVKGALQLVIFALAIKILASVCKDLASLSWEELAKGLVGVGILMGEVAIFLNTAKFSGKAMTTAIGIVILSSAILILESACEKFAQLSWEEIIKGLVSVGVLLGELAIFTKLTGNAKKLVSTGVAMIAIGAAMKIFASAVQDFSSMSWENLAKGLLAMAVSLAATTIALKFMPKNMVGMGVGLIAVATALVIMASALVKMGGMSWEELGKGLLVLGASIAILAIGLNAMRGTLAGAAAMVVAAIALGMLTPVLAILGAMSWEGIIKSLVAIAGAFVILGVAGAVLTPLIPSILGLAGAFALIGVGVLAVGAGLLAAGVGLQAVALGLGALVAGGVAGATAIVSALTIIITGVASLIPVIIEKIGEGIIAFCSVIAEGAPIVAEAIKEIVLSTMDALVTCIPVIVDGILSLVAQVLTSLVEYTPTIVAKIFEFLIAVLEGVAEHLPDLIVAVVDVFMAFFEGVIAAFGNIDFGTLVQGMAGVGLMAGVMAALAAVAAMTPAAMMGVLGMGAVIAELAIVLAAIGGLAQIPGLDWLINEGGQLMQSIGTAIGGFVGGIVGGFMGGVSSQFPKIGSDLSEFMTNVQPFIDGAKSIDETTMTGVRSLAEVILLLVGANLLEGITSWLTGGQSLTDFAEQLSGFGLGIRNFAMNVAGVDPEAVSAAAAAAMDLAKVADAIPPSGGLFQLIGGEHDMGEFAQQLSGLGLGIRNFAENVTNVDPATVSAAASAAVDLAKVADAIPPSGGLFQLIGGEHDMDKFAQQLSGLGLGIRNFAINADGVDPAVVTAAATAAVDLAKVAEAIPPSGGLFQLVGGEHDMGKFSEQLSGLGLGIRNFAMNVAGIDPEAVSAAAVAAVDLAKVAEAIPATGGLLQVFTGDHDMSKFAQQLSGLGLGIRNFAFNADGIDSATVSAAAAAAVDLAEMSSAIPTSGGLFNWCTGEHDMSKFAQQLSGLGLGIRNFAMNAEGADPATVSAAASAAKDLAVMANEMPSNTDNLNGFGVAMSDFGVNTKNYFNAVGGINPDTLTMADKAMAHVKGLPSSFDTERVNDAVSSLKELVTVAVSMSYVSPDTTKDFSTAMNNLLEIDVDSFTSTFSKANGVMEDAGKTLVANLVSGMKIKESEAKTYGEKIAKNVLTVIRNKYTEFKTVGQTIVTKLIAGIKDKMTASSDAMVAVVNDGRTKIRNQYDNFKGAGKYVVEGFAAGISANTFTAEAKAAAMAEAALDAAREALDEHSPSKEAYKIGDYFGLGFVNALDDYSGTAFNTAYEMADNAKRGLSGAIAKIKDVIDSDIDSQPTIRPVLDLSGVQSGVGTLNGIFGMTPSMGVLANVGSISAMMNTNQNGTNDDVVSAIKDLGDRIGEMSGDSYNLGDVTYDDGSNVHNAVKSLVRATRMERRR